jgi:lysine-specific permease
MSFGLPLFLLIWGGYRLVKGTRIVQYKDMQLDSNPVSRPN